MDGFPWPWPYLYSPGIQWEIEPEGLFCNSTLRFCKNFPAWSAQLWQLQYGLMPYAGQTSGPITFQSTALNGGPLFLVTVPPAITSAWKPGRYTWQCFREASGAARTRSSAVFVSTRTIIVQQDLTAPGAVDTRGRWQQIIDAFDAMLLETTPDTAYEIALGRGTIAGQNIKGWTKVEEPSRSMITPCIWPAMSSGSGSQPARRPITTRTSTRLYGRARAMATPSNGFPQPPPLS